MLGSSGAAEAQKACSIAFLTQPRRTTAGRQRLAAGVGLLVFAASLLHVAAQRVQRITKPLVATSQRDVT